jgi:hypothetical protein
MRENTDSLTKGADKEENDWTDNREMQRTLSYTQQKRERIKRTLRKENTETFGTVEVSHSQCLEQAAFAVSASTLLRLNNTNQDGGENAETRIETKL